MSTQPQPQASMPWVRRENGSYHCNRHDVDFTPPKTCKACAADKSPPIGAIEKRTLPRPPKGCRSSLQHEAWFTKIANDALGDVSRLGDLVDAIDTGKARLAFRGEEKDRAQAEAMFDFHVEVNLAKHRDVAIKAGRVASQLALAREDEDLVADRERRLRGGSKKERTH